LVCGCRYELIYSPHIAKLDLWKTSGHYDFYRENMFDQMAVEDEVSKPTHHRPHIQCVDRI
jgi:threonyl-tRNA synthetase